MDKTPRTRRVFDETFKRNAVNLMLQEGRSIRRLARELGVGSGLLHRWRREYSPGPNGPVELKQLQTHDQKDELIAWQVAEITRLKEREEILKKSLGILSETPARGMPRSKR